MKTFLLFFLCIACGSHAADTPATLTPEETQQIAAAKAAALKTSAMRAAAAKFSVARKAYQLDRQKFSAERSRDVAVSYRQAQKEYDEAVRKAILAQNPALAPLLARADAMTRTPKRQMNEGETVADADSMKNPAIRPIKDVPGLPRVLLIGDSISIGYTLPVRDKLKGKANVHRIPVNGGATEVGLARMKDWLGDGKWDVIHFNFGLHDAKYSSETTQRATREQYAENLRTLVAQMKATGAKLIFATTTPVPKGGVLSPGRKFDSIPERNKIAVQVMQENGVAIDDLYAPVLPVQEKVGRPNDVHYQPEGYELLAEAVAASIAAQLPKNVGAEADIVVYGGTSSGVVAAVQAARMGKSVVLIEPGRHLGGLTSGGLGATDFGKPESVGGIAREFYRRVKKHYADPAAWKWEKPADYRSHRHDPNRDVMWHLEPRVAEKILSDMIREAGVKVVFGERLDLKRGVQENGLRIESIVMESDREFRGRVFIDATYEGDLMAKAGVSYHVGREANSLYGETINGVQTRRVPYSGHNFFRPVSPYVVPGDPSSGLLFGVQREPPGAEGSGDRRVQAYCFRLCMTEVPENRVPFPKPAGYDASRYELLLRYLTSTGTFPDHPKPRDIEHPALGYRPYIVIMPNRKTDSNTKGAVSSNFVGGNYDYPDGDYATRGRIIAEHTRWQQGLLWFLQNDPRVPAAYHEPMQTWGLAKDEFTDNHHWPHQLYVREARRMNGGYVMTEHDCAGTRRAEDSIGLGSYGMDSHVTQRYVDARGWLRNEGTLGGRVPQPYPISYRALTPKPGQCDNLLVPVCCSASHAAYGSIRMEPVFMILGHAAATAACLAVDDDMPVQKLDYAKLRQQLLKDGQVLEWKSK